MFNLKTMINIYILYLLQCNLFLANMNLKEVYLKRCIFQYHEIIV